MVPSLVICPIKNTGVLVSFANRCNSAAHSRICSRYPGHFPRRGTVSWMESTITVEASIFYLLEDGLGIGFCQQVKTITFLYLPCRPSFICCSLSSPLIYKVTTSLSCKPICKNKLFAIRVHPHQYNAPLTIPPPIPGHFRIICNNSFFFGAADIVDRNWFFNLPTPLYSFHSWLSFYRCL